MPIIAFKGSRVVNKRVLCDNSNFKLVRRFELISWALKNKVLKRLDRERGWVRKEPGGRLAVCLVYPNVYSLGMANLGFQTACHFFNALDNCVCERAFLPEPSDIEEFARTNTPLFSYESQTPLKEFDLVAFSIPFEQDYLNIPVILRMSGIEIETAVRPVGAPLLMAGGAAVSLNPEPLADLFDAFLIGEAEGGVEAIASRLWTLKGSRTDKRDALLALDELDYVYVPALYEFSFEGADITGARPVNGAKSKVMARKNMSLDAYPLPASFISAPEAEFSGAHLVEIERGCPRGCRFCVAGFLYLPPRWRDLGEVKAAVTEGIERVHKVGLVGAAVSEYPQLKDVLDCGMRARGSMTLSSLRLDMLDAPLLHRLKAAGYSTITVAPEAAGERMRAVINKGMTGEQIMESVRLITEAGFAKLKLYFMIGLPTETDEDARAIVDMAIGARAVMKKGAVALSVNAFIPKPFTPFQWHGFEDMDCLKRRISLIKDGLKKERGITVNVMSTSEALVQAYLARADRRAGDFIKQSVRDGLKAAMRAHDKEMRSSVSLSRQADSILPWDFIDHGLNKAYLWMEYQKGLQGAATPPCDVGRCFRCGVCLPFLQER
ncbi:MAG: radical SAM protein [Deltaproteobacteria bacterium]|nr:radical SAM protein [Deltaproteobacteria bacterium]